MKFDWLQTRDNKPLTEMERLCQKYFFDNIYRPDLGDTYTKLDIPECDNIYDTLDTADRMRFEWLADHPNGAYFDFDCVPVKRFKPSENNKVYLPVNKVFEDKRILDIFLIYVNGNTDWIKKHFNQEVKEQYLKENAHRIKENFYGFPSELMEKYTGYGIIPEEFYRHGNLTMLNLQKEEKVNQNNLSVGEVVSGIDKKLHEVKGSVYLLEKVMKDLYDEANKLKKESGSIVTRSTNTDIENENLRQRIKELEEQLGK